MTNIDSWWNNNTSSQEYFVVHKIEIPCKQINTQKRKNLNWCITFDQMNNCRHNIYFTKTQKIFFSFQERILLRFYSFTSRTDEKQWEKKRNNKSIKLLLKLNAQVFFSWRGDNRQVNVISLSFNLIRHKQYIHI